MNRSMLSALVALCGILTASAPALAQDKPAIERVVPEIRAVRVNPHPPTIDGNLDDAIWQHRDSAFAPVFTQQEPNEGQLATESTLVAVAYDDHALYVAFWCYDTDPGGVKRQLVRRDRYAEADQVAVRLDPYHDHQTGASFNVNAAGVMRDTRVYNDDWSDLSWDAVWNAAVSEQPWGWSAEIEIPYHCLRFAKGDGQVWGIDFAREITRKGELSVWAFVPAAEGGFISKLGHLTGLEGIEPTRHLEVLPYAVSALETAPRSAGDRDGRDYLGNTGVDIKYGLASNLTLDATINPDFGQVELDEPVLNLSAYETFFEEKRPFFVEGADLYETNFDLFYSRRIGRKPSGDVVDDNRKYYTDYPKATTILGAAKLTGKIAPRTSIAVLSAVTDEERAAYAAEMPGAGGAIDTVARDGVVEPLAGYSVVRVKQEVLARSFVGGMFTMASQDTRHPALTGGADWRLFTNNGQWGLTGQTVFSRVDNVNTGFGLSASLDKAAGKHIRGSVGTTIKDPYLAINRLGYTQRNGIRSISAWVQYRTSDDWWIFRNTWNNLNYYAQWNYDGAEIGRGGNFNFSAEFTNYWSLGGGVEVQAEKYSDIETRGHGLWEWPVVPTWSWWFSLNTDVRKPISFNWNPGSGSDRGGSWWANYFGATFRPQSNMEFELGANYHRTLRGTRWVKNPNDTTTIFADLDKDEVYLHASASVLFSRNLSLQFSTEGLMSGLDYRNYRPYLGEGRYGPTQGGFDEDYIYSSINTMLLLRWEYRPGSTLYVVWTRARGEADGDANELVFNRDFDRFLSYGSENVFLIKASYWMNM